VAYVIGEGGRVSVVDVSTPTSPITVGTLDVDADDLAVDTGHLYVAAREDGLHVFDLTTPTSPAFAHTLDLYAVHVFPHPDDLLLVAGEVDDVPALGVLDIATSGPPTVLSTLPLDVLPTHVLADGPIVWTLARDVSVLGRIDLTDPALPVDLGRPFHPYYLRAFGREGDVLWLSSDQDLAVWDVSGPEAVSVSYHVPIGATSTVRVVTDGDYLYAVDGGSTLHVVDVRDPEAPSLAATFDHGGAGASDVDIRGDLLAIVGSRDLSLVDVTDPATPLLLSVTRLGDFNTDATLHGEGETTSVLYYLVNYDVHLYDVNDPTTPAFAGALGLPGFARDVVLRGNRLHLTTDSGLRTYDVTDPFAPIPLPTNPLIGEGALHAAGDLGIWMGEDAIATVDLAAPGTPVLGVADRPSDRIDIRKADAVVVGGTAYLEFGVGPRGVWVYDVATPSDPVPLGLADTSTGLALAAAGGIVYAMGDDLGAVPLSCPIVSTPGAPAASAPLRWSVPTPYRAGARLRLAGHATDVRIYDASGRRVRRLEVVSSRAATMTAWDGRHDSGAPAAAGVYIVGGRVGDQWATGRIVFVR